MDAGVVRSVAALLAEPKGMHAAGIVLVWGCVRVGVGVGLNVSVGVRVYT